MSRPAGRLRPRGRRGRRGRTVTYRKDSRHGHRRGPRPRHRLARRTCLIYGTSGAEYVVVASKGGADKDPAWFMNLEADPDAGVQVGTRRFTARARVATPAERASLWARMVGIFPLYDDYARQTDREIPVVLLTPLDGPH
ncbi:nitroreductase/quinone reductase family protein [Streptomyces sp. NPDC001658]